MKKITKKLLAIIVGISMLSNMISVMAIENTTAKSNTVYELVENLGIEINEATTIELKSIEKHDTNDYAKSGKSAAPTKTLVVKTAKVDGSIEESTIYAADANVNGDVEMVDMTINAPNNGARSTPTPTLSGNITDYGNLQIPAHDYYFLVGCSYTSKVISGEYALRPTAMWSLLRSESSGTVQIRNTNFYMMMSGFLVNSQGALVNGYTLAAFDMPTITRTPPTLGTQDYITLTNYWTSSGFAASDYLWMTTDMHSMSIAFEVYFANNKAALIEHIVYPS